MITMAQKATKIEKVSSWKDLVTLILTSLLVGHIIVIGGAAAFVDFADGLGMSAKDTNFCTMGTLPRFLVCSDQFVPAMIILLIGWQWHLRREQNKGNTTNLPLKT